MSLKKCLSVLVVDCLYNQIDEVAMVSPMSIKRSVSVSVEELALDGSASNKATRSIFHAGTFISDYESPQFQVVSPTNVVYFCQQVHSTEKRTNAKKCFCYCSLSCFACFQGENFFFILLYTQNS